jgi:hypothetical protein
MINDAYNMAALQLQAVIYRHENDKQNAYKILDAMLSLDVLNHFACLKNIYGSRMIQQNYNSHQPYKMNCLLKHIQSSLFGIIRIIV